MEGAAGELFTEFAKTVVPSLVKLIKYEWGLDQSVKDGLKNLGFELWKMKAFVETVSGMPPDQLDPQENLRCREVSELLSAIETSLYSFKAGIESTEGEFKPVQALNKKVINHQIDKYVKETLINVKQLRERHGPYPSRSSLESTSTPKVDPHILAMYTKEPHPEGIEGPATELTEMLSKRQYVSIFGMVGLGKTTLARAVYDQMKGGFDCSAFVRTGQSATKKVLKDILCELRIKIYVDAPEEEQLIELLRSSIEHKRCLLFIDDIRDDGIWNLVERVFKVSAGSQIITTTRKRKVAKEIGGAYPMKPLSHYFSKKLLSINAEADIHDADFGKVADKIFHKCGGVPIAINAIGRFLAKNKNKGWHTAYDSIGFDEHKKDGVFEHIKKALSCSYYDLPYHIQKCFLYLSLFPEDHWIEKNMLIWRWVAEGLVSECAEQTDQGLFELGETYFDELIDRSMIQWAVSPRDIGQGGCRVHSLMFQLIRDLSSSKTQNFSTVLGRKQEKKQDSTSESMTIHRLAIHRTTLDDIQNTNTSPKKNSNTSLELGEVLSFYASTCPGSSIPPLSRFARLRVIDLEDCDLSVGDHKLKHLSKSSELAYVGLLGTPVAKLPKKIGRLKLLQTLDVTGTGIKELPLFICELKKLRCLRACKGTRMLGRVGGLTSLEELWLHSADKSPDFAVELRKLTELRVLVIHFDEMVEGMQQELVESLSVLKKLQVLQVWFDAKEKVRLPSWEESVPFPKLRQLLLFGIIQPRLMPWIHDFYVQNLSKLLLEVEVLEAQNLKILGEMSSLLSLYLHSEAGNRLSYTAGKDEFKVLEYLYTNIELVCGDGALPMIQELDVAGIRVGTDVGLRKNNMPLLERASYHLDCKDCGPEEVRQAEAQLRQASQAHPNHPTVSIKRFNNFVLEMQHMVYGSVVPEAVKAALKVLPVKGLGGSPGLGGARGKGKANSKTRAFSPGLDGAAGKGQDNANSSILDLCSPAVLDALSDAAARSAEAFGAPPTLVVGKNEGTGSTSPAINTSTDCTFSQLLECIILQSSGMDLAEVLNAMMKCFKDPEVLATLKRALQNTNGSFSLPALKLCGVPQAIAAVAFREFQPSVGVLGTGAGTSANTGVTIGTQGENSKLDARSLLAMFDSLVAPNALLPIMYPARCRNIVEKWVRDTEIIDCINRLSENAGESQYANDFSRLMKLTVRSIVNTMTQETNGPVTGRGADADLAWKKHPDVASSRMSAEDSGTSGSSCEPPPQFEASLVLTWLDTPAGVTFCSDQAALSGTSVAAFRKRVEKLVSTSDLKTDGTARGQDVASNMSAENSGTTGSSCDPQHQFDANIVTYVLNSPKGAALISERAAYFTDKFAWAKMSPDAIRKVLEKCMCKPEMIASMEGKDGSKIDQVLWGLMTMEIMDHVIDQHMGVPSSTPGFAGGGGQIDISDMLSGLLRHLAVGSQMNAAASSSASLAQGVGEAPESSQDGETLFSMMVDKVFPAFEQAAAAGASSGQRRSLSPLLMPDNVEKKAPARK